MKKSLILLSALAFAVSTSFAQLTSPSPSVGAPVQVTPTPTPTVVLGSTASPVCQHFTVNASAIAALGAATSGNIPLFSLSARSVITQVVMKHSVSVAGASISAATARVTTTNNNYGSGAFDVFQAVGATTYQTDFTPKVESTGASTIVNLAMTSTGANLANVTAGTIDVWITSFQLPL